MTAQGSAREACSCSAASWSALPSTPGSSATSQRMPDGLVTAWLSRLCTDKPDDTRPGGGLPEGWDGRALGGVSDVRHEWSTSKPRR
ncbi:MAG: hypothetical protein WDW36_009891 [Sanguina aurantia]